MPYSPRTPLTAEQLQKFGTYLVNIGLQAIGTGNAPTPMGLRQFATRCAQQFNQANGLRHDGVGLSPAPIDLPTDPEPPTPPSDVQA